MSKKIAVRSKGKTKYIDFDTAPRQATISKIEQPKQVPAKYDFATSDQPYRAQRGEHMDIARAFVHISIPLAVAAPFAIASFTWIGLGIPIFSLVTFGVMVATSVITYFGTWLLSQFFSHYGVQVLQALLGYRLLRHEQNERFKNYRE